MELCKQSTSIVDLHQNEGDKSCTGCSHCYRAPLAAQIWKIFSDPILSIYSNLEGSSHNLDWLLSTILKCNREMSDLLIPKAYSYTSRKSYGIREEQYKAFSFWLLGHIFYINGKLSLSQLHTSSINVQVKCVKSVSFQSNHIFADVFGEYLLVLEDILEMKTKKCEFQKFTLERFTPSIVDIGGELKLTPIYIEVESENLAEHLTETVLKIMEGILDGMTTLSEDIFFNIMKILVETIKIWGTSVQTASLKVASELFRLKLDHLNEQASEALCKRIDDLINIKIPFLSHKAYDGNTSNLIKSIFILFTTMLKEESHAICYPYFIKMIWKFLELECMAYYPEERENLMSILSTCLIPKLPIYSANYNPMKREMSQVENFLNSLYSLENCLRSEVLSKFQSFTSEARNHKRDDSAFTVWSVEKNVPDWLSFTSWYDLFCSTKLVGFSVYFSAVLRLSCYIIKIAFNLSLAMEEQLLITPVPCGTLEISFFDGILEKVFETLVTILMTLEAHEINDSSFASYEMVFRAVGNILKVPSYIVNINKKNSTAIALLSLPWDVEIRSAWEDDLFISEPVLLRLQSSLPHEYKTKLQCISINYLCCVSRNIAFSWRLKLLEMCFHSKDADVVIQAINSIPFYLKADFSNDLANKLVDLLDNALLANEVVIHIAIAKVIKHLICTMSGVTFIRNSVGPDPVFEMICEECDPSQLHHSDHDLSLVNHTYEVLQNLFKLYHSQYTDVRLEMVKAICTLANHSKIVEPRLLTQCLTLLEDGDYNIRLKMSTSICSLVYSKCFTRGINTNSCEIDFERSLAKEWFDDFYKSIFGIVKQHLIKSKREFQETLLIAVQNIGSVKCDYAVLPVLKLLIVFLIHPLTLVNYSVTACFMEFCKAQEMSPVQIFKKFRVEICCLVSCIAVLSMSRKNFRLSSVAKRVACMFDYGNAFEFLQVNLQYILPPLIPFQKQEQAAILTDISFFLSTTTNQLLTNQFRYIYTYLYLNEDESTFNRCLEYIKEVGTLDIPHVKKISSEAIQNQLILHLHLKPEKVISGLSDFMVEELLPKPKHMITKEHVAEFLQPRILGILLFLDSMITAPTTCQSTKEKAFACLPELIRFMGPNRLTPIKFKILATLKTSLRVTDGNFPSLTCNAWEAFVRNVELGSLGSLLSQIFISLLPVIDKFPEKISAIFRYLVIENKEIMKEHIPELYFVSNHEAIEDVYQLIQELITELWPKDFRECLTMLHKYITHDNVDVKVNGLKKLRKFLKEHQSELKDFVLNFGNEDSILSELIEALIIGCRDRDSRVRIACGECFGEIGAIDSAHLPRSNSPKDESEFIFDIRDEEFAVAALTKFLKAFMSARDTADMDRFALAIQVFLKEYLASFESDSKKNQFWNKFPVSMQQIMKPFKSTHYMVECENCDIWKPHPIYGSSAGTSFQAWAYRWVCNMLTIEKDEFKLKILSACRACLKFDVNVLIFLLPHIFVNAVIKANVVQSWKLIEEIVTVMSSPSIDSKESELSVEVEVVNLRSYVSVESHTDSPKEMRVMCLNTVFSLIDYLSMWVRQWNHKFGKKEEQKDKRAGIIKSFLNKISKLTIANKNFECREYPRALLYLEQHVQDHPSNIEEHYHFFEKIYARLNDPDAVAGVLAVQKQPPTFEQLILSHEANGQWQDAATCYEKMAQSGCPETGYAMGMVNCYLKLDQPHAALGLIEGLSAQRPELSELLMENRLESLMKMNDWGSLMDYGKPKECISSNLWYVNLGNALLSLRDESSCAIPHIDTMREALMSSLCAISIDKGAYERGYPFIVRSQIISEIEKGAEVISTLQSCIATGGENILKNFIKEWNGKLKFVHHSTTTLEQILSVRRMILSIIREHFQEKNVQLSNLLLNEIGSSWIESAKSARNSRYFQQSYMYILNAEKFHLKNVFIEKAKLFWERDDTNLALSTLRKGIAETFPDAASFKILKDRAPLEDRKICAEAKLLLAYFNDENINADIDENLLNYKDSVETYQKWEKNLVYLAQYYDRILDVINADDECTGRESQLHMINYFGKSLEFGCEYLYHSMPRMLTIWLDYGAKLAEKKETDKGDIFTKMTKLIETFAGRLPTFMFLSAFSQITTRLCHPHPLVYSILRNIIAKVIIAFPHQSLWMIMAVYKSSNAVLSRKCSEIFSICKKKDKKTTPIINDYIMFADLLISLCNKQASDSAQTATLTKLSPVLAQMFRVGAYSQISLPLQKFITITMPLDLNTCQANHNPFPKEPVYISGIEDKIYIFSSLQKPKKINLKGSDGNQYALIIKSKDDLRKDLRVMEFNRLVNSFLQSDAEACQRSLHIRTYSVVPLNEDCGVIEWIPNLIGLRSLLNEIYAKMGKTTTTAELKRLMCAAKDPLSKKRSVFLEKLLPKHPPVFDTWFFRNFSDPQGWYMARNAYIRTTAVMSIVGYVLGLGDRHGENILFDSTNGDTVHVDLSCIFNQGEKFTCPERVPFRLTHNMVKAMGLNGVEGIFRRSCEITLRILKRESTTLMAVLTPLVYDHTMSCGNSNSDSHEVTSKVAQEHLHNIKQRLQGFVSTKGGKFSISLSTEGQVEKLISEATSIENLCQMYIGWGAYL